MSSLFTVRPAVLNDATGMAKVHVETWRETYRGLMSDATLDHPGFLSWRERFWTAALSDPQYVDNVVAVAFHQESLIGIAMAGPSQAQDSAPSQLFILYTYAAFHGSGIGGALLDAVLDPMSAATLWVADPNPRAQAFYRKHRFAASGISKIEDGVQEIEMVRSTGSGRLQGLGTEASPMS